MRNNTVIDFQGMRFRTERFASDKLRKRAKAYRAKNQHNYVAKNVRGIFDQIFGF